MNDNDNNKTFKVGDKIVHYSKIFRIFKIKGRKNKDKVIFFRSLFKSRENRKLVFSIPMSLINRANIRKLLSRNKLKLLLKKLAKKPDIKAPINLLKVKEGLNLNDPEKNIQILNCLWGEKNDQSTSFNKSKEEALKLAIKQLSQELALVNNISLTKAQQKIKKVLDSK